MSSIGTGYDLSASQFSPDGRVFQIEYAHKAVENSGTVVALRGKDCVVFAVEKIVSSKLFQPSTNRRIFTIDRHIGMAIAGLISDGRQLVETARSEADSYRTQYGNPIPVKYLVDRVSMYMHAYTLYSAIRPYGCSVMISGYDQLDGPILYMLDPSGIAHGYFGCAAGKAKQAAKTELEKLSLVNLSAEEIIKQSARIIYFVHDELKDKQFELELSYVGACTNGLHKKVPEEMASVAEREAKASLEEDSDSGGEEV